MHFFTGHFDKNFKILPFPRNDLFRSLCLILSDLWWSLESQPAPFLVYSSFQMTKISTKFRKSTWTFLTNLFHEFFFFYRQWPPVSAVQFGGFKTSANERAVFEPWPISDEYSIKVTRFFCNCRNSQILKTLTEITKKYAEFKQLIPGKNNYLTKDKIVNFNKAKNINQGKQFHFSINLQH